MDTELKNDSWTEVISSHRGLLDLRLKELWQYRDLISMFVKRDFASNYKQTILGPIWFFITPFITPIMYTFVFSTIAGLKTDGIPAPIFYLAGTSLWGYFQSNFTSSAGTFVNNSGIFGKVYFPRLVAPISTTISNFIKFFLQLLVLLLLVLYYVFFNDFSIQINNHIFLFPFLLILIAGIALGVGIIASAVTTKYRDLGMFINIGVSMLMYFTPVIYPISQVPQVFKPFLMLNPLAPVFETFRYSLFGLGSFSWAGLGYSTCFMVVVLAVGVVIFNQVEKTFMDTV